MAAALQAYWWSPRRQMRTMITELRHPGSWMRLLGPPGTPFTSVVVPLATGRLVTWAPLERADVCAIGSILDPYLTVSTRARVWGSGSVRALSRAPVDLKDRFIAVRGELTREGLGLDPAVPTGDPGLLVRLMSVPARRRHGRVFIPHFTAFGKASGRNVIRAYKSAGYQIAPPTVSPRHMVDIIARAEEVVSSGMHGVILSHALGTPVTPVDISDDLSPTATHKYRDYFSALAVPARTEHWKQPLDDRERSRLTDAAHHEKECIDRPVDSAVEGLLAAARNI
jgi:pyruvyltransferase